MRAALLNQVGEKLEIVELDLAAPKAGEALLSFVEHVVDTSRKYRSS